MKFLFALILTLPALSFAESYPIDSLNAAFSLPLAVEANVRLVKGPVDACTRSQTLYEYLDLEIPGISERLKVGYGIETLSLLLTETSVLKRPLPATVHSKENVSPQAIQQSNQQQQQCQQQAQQPQQGMYVNSRTRLTYLEGSDDLSKVLENYKLPKLESFLSLWLKGSPSFYIDGGVAWDVFEKLESKRSLRDRSGKDFPKKELEIREGENEVCFKATEISGHGAYNSTYVGCFME